MASIVTEGGVLNLDDFSAHIRQYLRAPRASHDTA